MSLETCSGSDTSRVEHLNASACMDHGMRSKTVCSTSLCPCLFALAVYSTLELLVVHQDLQLQASTVFVCSAKTDIHLHSQAALLLVSECTILGITPAGPVKRMCLMCCDGLTGYSSVWLPSLETSPKTIRPASNGHPALATFLIFSFICADPSFSR